jgi:hypothetical protein
MHCPQVPCPMMHSDDISTQICISLHALPLKTIPLYALPLHPTYHCMHLHVPLDMLVQHYAFVDEIVFLI